MANSHDSTEPVAWRVHPFDYGIGHEGVYATTHLTQQRDAWLRKGWNVESLYTAAPVAQQYEAGDVASASAQGFRDGVASVAQQPLSITPAELAKRIERGEKWEVAQQPQADSIHVAAFDRLMALCESKAQRIIELEDKQPQAEPARTCDYNSGSCKRRGCAGGCQAMALCGAAPQQAEALSDDLRDRLVAIGQAIADQDDRAAQAMIREILAAPQQAEAVPNTLQKAEAHLLNLIGEYWALAYAEGEEGRNHDTEDGAAQRTHAAIAKAVKDLIAAASSTPQQAEAVPPTHVMVPVEPTDEMIDAACEAAKDLYWVDFVRAYKAAIAQQKGANHE